MKKNIVIIASCKSGHNFVRNQIKSWSENFRTFNFEDVRPSKYKNMLSLISSEGYILSSQSKVKNVIVIRDLLNWWASYLTWMSKSDVILTPEKIRNAFDIWSDQVEEAYNTKYLSNRIRVIYDEFRSSRTVRKFTCELLEGEYTEKDLNSVPTSGNGSSFDGLKFNGRGNEMATDLRYLQIQKTELFETYKKYLIENERALSLYKRYFWITPEQEEFMNELYVTILN